MKPFKRFIGSIPYWAYMLVFAAVFVNTVYLIYMGQISGRGVSVKFENGYYIHDYIRSGSAFDKAGIRPGDTLVTINSVPVEQWELIPEVGDTIVAGIMRNSQEIGIPIIIVSVLATVPGFFWSIYIIMVLFSAGSLFLLYKKPRDKAVLLLFIYIQMFIATVNASHLPFSDAVAVAATVTFQILGCLLGPVLIHFHLLFPRPVNIVVRHRRFPVLFYSIGALLALGLSASYIHDIIKDTMFGSAFHLFNRMALMWLTVSYFLALAIAIYQFINIKDTLSRNQLRIVIIGTFFSCITPISLALFYDQVSGLNSKIPYLISLAQGIGGVIMIMCILIAIFRYRIWDIEVFFKKALLYLGATVAIILFYLLLLYLVDLSTIKETRITRFVILSFSVIIFLAIRDQLQRLIERMFHRETYDSATVVSDFEEKLAGIYITNDLKSGIVSGLDEIFHFKTFVFSMKINEKMYEPVFALGVDPQKIKDKFEIDPGFEKMLKKSKVFSPGELDMNLSLVEATTGELVIPLQEKNQPYGFFICGPKKSEKTYSMQDIRVLSLIARRVTALFHTAALYQKDLERQLMLERERGRISQDMHDDVGASLTRISMMSDLVRNMADIREDARQWLGQISGTSRGVMEEMNQIIWALNPKNDNLEGLITYIRRFAFEYLEPTSVECFFDLPDEIRDRALSVEVRRNVYLVAREAIHNVVKHAGSTKVLISLVMNENGFRIKIKDDGKGFDPAKLEFPGNGLVNMKNRMNDIGGEFLIHSEVGGGTEIEIVVVIG